MKVSELWLKTFIDLPFSTEEWALQLTNAGLEVDNLEMVEAEAGSEAHAKKVNEAEKNQEKKQKKKDAIITLKIPANRGDCLSMEGVARELAALNQMDYHPIPLHTNIPNINSMLDIHLNAGESCPQYVGRIIQNFNPEIPTPDYIQERLEKAGIRSISLVVDILNYVMLELGQPLHAFDLNTIDSEINIRYARTNEEITLLDGKLVKLTPDILVIADKTKPMAIAGVMGGLHSSVSPKTTTLFLESAYFNPIHIRQMAKLLGLRTESSIRFERGVDFALQNRAIERATQLIVEIAGGNVGPTLEKSIAENLPLPTLIFLKRSSIQKILGVSFRDEELQNYLRRLGLEVLPTLEGFEIKVPTFRIDINQEEDVVEEIARMFGLHKLPNQIPVCAFEFNPISENQLKESDIKTVLINRGYNEAITYSFIDPKLLDLFNPNSSALTLSNPISSAMATMRVSLLPGLLEALQYNQRRQQPRIKLFEMGNCFIQDNQQLIQKKMLAGLCFGGVFPEQWGSKPREFDFYDLKGDIENLLSRSGKLNSVQFKACQSPYLHPEQAAEIIFEGSLIGTLGLLHPRILKERDISGNVVAFELEVEKLLSKSLPQFQEISKYPSIRRDIAIIVKKNVLADDLKSTIINTAGSLLKEIKIFDIYEGKGIESGSKSVALGLILQHPTRTLIESEVNEHVEKILQALHHQYQAILRD